MAGARVVARAAGPPRTHCSRASNAGSAWCALAWFAIITTALLAVGLLANAFDGGGARTTAMGAIPAGPRTPSQARMELTIALSAGVPYGSA